MGEGRGAHLVVHDGVGYAHLAAQRGQPHNQLDGVHVGRNHNQLGLQHKTQQQRAALESGVRW